MRKNNSLKDNIQPLSRIERKVFEKACNNLMKIGWDSTIEYDQDDGWIILAGRTESQIGYVLRNIKPFVLNSLSDFDKALKLQNRLRLCLVEVLPYKIFLGNKSSLSELDKPFKWLTEADFPFWSKFFQNKKIEAKLLPIGEANNLRDNQLVGGNFLEATNGSKN